MRCFELVVDKLLGFLEGGANVHSHRIENLWLSLEDKITQKVRDSICTIFTSLPSFPLSLLFSHSDSHAGLVPCYPSFFFFLTCPGSGVVSTGSSRRAAGV